MLLQWGDEMVSCATFSGMFQCMRRMERDIRRCARESGAHFIAYDAYIGSLTTTRRAFVISRVADAPKMVKKRRYQPSL